MGAKGKKRAHLRRVELKNASNKAKPGKRKRTLENLIPRGAKIN